MSEALSKNQKPPDNVSSEEAVDDWTGVHGSHNIDSPSETRLPTLDHLSRQAPYNNLDTQGSHNIDREYKPKTMEYTTRDMGELSYSEDQVTLAISQIRKTAFSSQEQLYLLLVYNDLQEWFNILCYDFNTWSLEQLEQLVLTNQLRNANPLGYKLTQLKLQNILQQSTITDYQRIINSMNIEANAYRGFLLTHGIKIIEREDIIVRTRIAHNSTFCGTVYKAEWRRPNGTTVDVCVRYAEDFGQEDRFLEEAKWLAKLHHENILQLYGVVVFGPYAHSVALVLEYANRGSLLECSSRQEITTVRAVHSIACQIAAALVYLEENGFKAFSIGLYSFFVFDNQKIKFGGFQSSLLIFDTSEKSTSAVYRYGHLLLDLFQNLPTLQRSYKLFGQYWQQFAPKKIVEVCQICISPVDNKQMSIKEVLLMLEQIKFTVLTVKEDYTSHTPIEMNLKKGEEITVLSEDPSWVIQFTEVFVFYVPAEILARGPEAEHAYRNALLEGKVQVYRGRIMLIGQDRAGKTSLKKSLLGIPFDPGEVSTEGIEVDPSTFEVDVEQVSRWQRLCDSDKAGNSNNQSVRALARLIAEELFRGQASQDMPDVKAIASLAQRQDLADASLVETAFLLTSCRWTGLCYRMGYSLLGKVTTSVEQLSIESDDPIDSTVPNVEEHSFITETETIALKLSLPEELVALVSQELGSLLAKKNGDHMETRKETVLDVWDFAGQHLYYATHPVFFSSRAVYVLTHNLSKNLNERAEPCMRQGVADIKLDNANNETNLENLISWLVTVHCIQSLEERDKEAELLSDKTGTTRATKTKYLRPPVLIVGTHADQPCVPVKQAHALLAEAICGKTYDEHVIRPFFSVDNTKSSDDQGIQDLKTKIANVLESEPYMGETLPAKWFNFEKAIAEQIERNVYFLPLSEVRRIAQTECFIIDDQEVNTMLNFYHDLRVIVKHAGTVVLQSQWLINLFKKLITVRTFDHMDPTHAKYWKTLEKTGTLHQSLIDHVFGEIVPGNSQAQQDLLSMMERYGLIARLNAPDENSQQSVQYFVPAQLTSSPESLTKACPKDGDPCPLLIHFPDGFVPHGLFPQLVSRLIVKFSELGFSHKPKLHRNGARFFIGPSRDFDLYLVCCKRYVKATLTAGTPTALQACNVGLPKQVRMLLEDALSELSREWDWLERMSTELCVLCCACAVEECEEHSQVECPDEGCGHVISVEERPLVCENVSERARLVAPGLERWFDDEHVDETCECVPKTGQPSREDLVLLADDIGVVWERLGRALGLKDSILEQLKADESKLYERCYGMLERWNQTQGASATFENLGQALLHSTVLRRDLARKYCGMVTV
ncbi:predicted protein [Nematostella vectensis]|uniref:Death domain-containing protein n=1 Tax=Nematostella vectensis TaxID=45351 RepID=A7RN40_NEMVE|nr:predicted protein [Nematostella vectensis]|eukprot:XP_001639132.1 predicted protein [Nematostella vectensis]